MSEMHADLKAAQQRIQVLERNLRDAEEANRRLAKQVIKADQRVSDLNGEVLRLGLQLKHHLQLQAERDALAAKLAELEGQEPIGEVVHSDVLPNAEGKYRHEFMSDFRIGVQAELFARPVPAEQPDALEQARGEEREACIAIAKEAVEGATISKYATPREARAARGMAAHLLDAIRARGEKP